MAKKIQTVHILSERMDGEEFLIVGVFATYELARVKASELAAANGPRHQTEIQQFTVIAE